MTLEQWWELLDNNFEDITNIVLTYHPSRLRDAKVPSDTVVGAAGWHELRKRNEHAIIHSVLEATWMGIPESRYLVDELAGFYVLCDLCSEYEHVWE